MISKLIIINTILFILHLSGAITLGTYNAVKGKKASDYKWIKVLNVTFTINMIVLGILVLYDVLINFKVVK